ncbi:hypothetical protein JG688_00002544 [Phytophthora aleatoria]|uniref:PX domain-containing protein n=1 Tax=Phytophthora aleatoria TaxID=2496075 RepID=A0A8J5J438_9STRA|nr:hypothetical protein JG688_00002544 [Phytophthora aleatoria]
MGTRSRTLKYLPGHQLRFGIAAVSRDPATGDVEEAVCLFCKHFGREQRADKKRKSASTVKYFRDSFRPDQYTQHHQLQHPTQWTKYKDASDGERRSFFPLMKTEESTITTPDSSNTADMVLIPTMQERGRCFDVKASIVEVVAVLAVGLGPVEPTVQTRDRLVYEYMTHHNYEGEQPSNCPRWSPPPNTFESCYVSPFIARQKIISSTMQFFAAPKDSLVAAALEASMRSVRLCNDNANAFSLEEHQRWCAERVKERVVLKVSAPEARGSYLQKHTTYLVTQESHQEGVRRRFRDFEWLHVVLHARYVGLLIPSLPEKTTTAAVLKSNAFMQSRMRRLQRFLNDIIQSPYLRSDAAVARFLGEPGDEATWEAMRKSTAVMDNAGEGHMRWLQRIMCEHIASSPETEISVFKRHVEQRERMLGELAACAKRLADRSAAMAKDVNTLHAIFAGWQLAETGTGSFETRNDGPLVALLDKSTATISGWSQVESFQPAIYELLLLENVKYMLHQATAMKQMLIERERAVAGESSPEQKPSPPSSESSTSPPTSGFSVASFTSAASRFMSAVEPPSLSIEEQQRRAHHVSELITRALMAEEMQRFRVETTKELENIMNHFSCAEAQLSKRSSSVWRDYLKRSPTDPQALAQSTKELLDSASTTCTSPSPSAADAF